MTPAASGTRRRVIETWLRDQVIYGREGDQLPSEAELATKFDVSRMTARQAVQSLAADGLVSRQRGSGTFIAAQPLHRHSGPLMSFTEDMRRRGLRASSRLMTAELREATQHERDALRLVAPSRVVAISRLRLADGQPMAIENTMLAPDMAAVLGHDLEAGSLHAALRELGRVPTTALCRISARAATVEESTLLELPRKASVLQEQRSISDQHAESLEHTTTVYAADRYVIDAVLSFTS